MLRRSGLDRTRLQCEQLESRETPAGLSTWDLETFDSTNKGSLPTDWQQWSSSASTSFAVTDGRALSGNRSLATAAGSSQSARAWFSAQRSADFGISAHVYLDSLQPIHVVARGQGLDTVAPTFYSLSVRRGLQAQILKTVNGVTTVLATINSKAYFSGNWLRVTLTPEGDQLRAELFRPDTGQYLNSAGLWQTSATDAISATDSTITSGGSLGVHRPAAYSGVVLIDDVRVLGPGVQESFDAVPTNQVPDGWATWSNDSVGSFKVSTSTHRSPSQSLVSTSSKSTSYARAWFAGSVPENVRASASVLLNTLVPTRIFVRGSGLDSAAPTYYAVSIQRGAEVQLVRVVGGVATSLGKVKSQAYTSNIWAKVTITANGERIQARVMRHDTGQYLDSAGNWTTNPSWAIEVSDATMTDAGFAGVERPKLYGGAIALDDFEITTAGDSTGPAVAIQSPTPGQVLTGAVTLRATAEDGDGVERVEFLVDGVVRHAVSAAPYSWTFDSASLPNGSHTFSVIAYDPNGNSGTATVQATTENVQISRPAIPRHYSHIRIAQLAYTGTPFTQFENSLLQNSVDLVVPHPRYLSQIDAIAPATPQLVYSNVSNLYEQLLTDWLTYADAHGINRELAFYHAAQPVAWSGDSPSSMPVNWFWSVRRGSNLATLTNLTSAARDAVVGDVSFGSMGESVYIGFVERFREVNFNLSRGASAGWAGEFEYASAVDAAGNPTSWKPLALLANSTQNLTQSGTATFDPPVDWAASKISGSAPMYFVRVRTTNPGLAPAANTILGRNYVNATTAVPPSGKIPVFDANADSNRDGYLNDAEYTARASGKDARFMYESRTFYPYYGQMRFVTNPSELEVRQWAADYHVRFLQANPLADGLFMDNSHGRHPLANAPTVETGGNYSEDFGAMLRAINQAIAPRWVAANTAGGGLETDAVIRNTPMSIEEFAIRPLAHNRVQFEDLATLVNRRRTLASNAYLVLDSLPTGGSATDPRTQIATLAYYYMLGDPESTFLMFYGGDDPNSSWTEHWSPAAAYNVGRPRGAFSSFAEGSDPQIANLTYKVYKREYDNALVLYKPLSYKLGIGTGSLADVSATTHGLNGTYRPLNADGTLGGPITSVTLRNGEGAVLIRM